MEEEGGRVHIRDDKAGVMGKAFLHWDDKGHAITWQCRVPAASQYHLTIRYSTSRGARRKLTIDGEAYGAMHFPVTGGFGSNPSDWGISPFRLKESRCY